MCSAVQETGSTVRLSRVDNSGVVSVGEMSHKVKLELHSREDREKRKREEKVITGENFVTHPCASPPHKWTCVFMLYCATCSCRAQIVRSAGEQRESCPEIPWHGVPKSFHYKGDTHRYRDTHRGTRNEFSLYVPWTKKKEKTGRHRTFIQ